MSMRDFQKGLVEMEKGKMELQMMMNQLTERCINICIPKMDVTRLSDGEKTCLGNCANRWLDTHEFMVERMYPSGPEMEKKMKVKDKVISSE
mmetsp:Transcript_23783/g.32445  ORF Transcript_23783/g.32445 Transcript_23783/m.32445 type:complete len:92 (-) Transcript_23783:62-337(-)